MIRRLLIVAAATTTAILLTSMAASAEINGNCTAQMSSSHPQQRPVDVKAVSSKNKAQAVKVPWDGTVTASATSPGPVGDYGVELEYWGFRWKVAGGSDDSNSWTTTKAVKPFATYGTGYYIVHGVSSDCDGAVLVNILGKSALSTVGGLVALGLSVVGFGGVLVTSIACGFGKGMGIPRTTWVPEQVSEGWTKCGTPGQFVHWCGTAAQQRPPTEVRRICGTQLFQESMREVCRG